MLLPSRPRGPEAASSSRRPGLLPPSTGSGGRPQRHPCSSGRRRRRWCSWPAKIRYEAAVAVVAVALGSGRRGGDGESRTLKAISLRRGCELRFASLLSSRLFGLSTAVSPRRANVSLSLPLRKRPSHMLGLSQLRPILRNE